jgi:hypothetical protein
MKEYKVVKVDCYPGLGEQFEGLLNKWGEQGWILKTIFREEDMAYAEAILERDKPPLHSQVSRK